jgi:hypothetical protein
MITVFPSIVPPGSTNPFFLSGAGVIGSIASSVTQTNTPLETSAIRTTNVSVRVNGAVLVRSNVPTAYLWQESKRDPAGFDINRNFALYSNILSATSRTLVTNDFYRPAEEDTDFFAQAGTPWALVNTDAADSAFDVFPRLSPVNNSTNRFRMTVTLGGFVFGPERLPPDPPFNLGTNTLYGVEPAKVGVFILQTGRLEP